MKILIVGKNGQVGLSLANSAKKAGIDFIAVGRDELDITQSGNVASFFKSNHAFDAVINAAAYTNVDGAETDSISAHDANGFAVLYLAQACKQYNIPLIHISTDYIFDGEKVTGYHEDDLPNPQNVYGHSKLAGENHLKNTWHKHIILRVSWVFSEFGKNFVKTIAGLSDKRDQFSVVCDQFGSPTSAKSIADAIIHICKTLHDEKNSDAHWGVYHFADFPITNWHQLAQHVVRVKHPTKNIEIAAIECKDYPTAAKRPKNSMLNTQKIKNVFQIDQGCWMNEVERILKIT
jgi:dTDP-4-dehydrorhamnose reductase